jgi:hypothetical protein
MSIGKIRWKESRLKGWNILMNIDEFDKYGLTKDKVKFYSWKKWLIKYLKLKKIWEEFK